MKKALVLAGGVPQIEMIRELQTRGYFVILADYLENPVAKSYADKFYRKSTLDVQAIREIAVKEEVNLLLTCCTDQALETVSRLSAELHLPCYIGADIGLAVTNKQYMKGVFSQNHIPTAKYQVLHAGESLQKMDYPMVVKPADCNSSKGVVRVNDEDELRAAVGRALQYSRTDTVIVEEYIDGEEVSVDLFVCDRKAKIICISNTEKIKFQNKFIISKGIYPAAIDRNVYEKIAMTAQKIADAFDLDNCPMLIQLLVKDGDISIVEFSARTGGCIKYHLIELASGVPVIKHTVDAFEGKKVQVMPVFSKKYIVDEFVYCQRGTFDKLQGFDACMEAEAIEAVFLLKSRGEKFEGIESSGDRIAAITIVADSYQDYIEKHNRVAVTVKVLDPQGNDIMRHDLFTVIKEDGV